MQLLKKLDALACGLRVRAAAFGRARRAFEARGSRPAAYPPLTPVDPPATSSQAMAKSKHRNFKAAAKFSPKKHRTQIGAHSTGKPFPAHFFKRKRRCKMADDPNDYCPHYHPNRSRCVPRRMCRHAGPG